jgi:thiamine biosynthesis lipoprotein
MATEIGVHLPRHSAAGVAAAREVLDLFGRVEQSCTRFRPDSPLMRANAGPGRWHRVPPVCFAAVQEAHRAYLRTRGRFDPRVLSDLERLGYVRSLPFAGGGVRTGPPARRTTRRRDPWRPRFRGGPEPQVWLGPDPVDLGGIGKGLALRWAAQDLRRTGRDFLVEAGGDCVCVGLDPGGRPWSVGVEDPAGGDDPLAVLSVSGLACATSSVRVRSWRAGNRPVHHLVDPDTGEPGGHGLAAVTVVGRDPARAEVWSKVLFLAGPAAVAVTARRRGLAALWVTTGGDADLSPALQGHVAWRR